LNQKGEKQYLGTTHLDHKKNNSTRLKQVREILSYVKALDKPIILGGDFNAHPG